MLIGWRYIFLHLDVCMENRGVQKREIVGGPVLTAGCRCHVSSYVQNHSPDS